MPVPLTGFKLSDAKPSGGALGWRITFNPSGGPGQSIPNSTVYVNNVSLTQFSVYADNTFITKLPPSVGYVPLVLKDVYSYLEFRPDNFSIVFPLAAQYVSAFYVTPTEIFTAPPPTPLSLANISQQRNIVVDSPGDEIQVGIYDPAVLTPLIVWTQTLQTPLLYTGQSPAPIIICYLHHATFSPDATTGAAMGMKLQVTLLNGIGTDIGPDNDMYSITVVTANATNAAENFIPIPLPKPIIRSIVNNLSTATTIALRLIKDGGSLVRMRYNIAASIDMVNTDGTTPGGPGNPYARKIQSGLPGSINDVF